MELFLKKEKKSVIQKRKNLKQLLKFICLETLRKTCICRVNLDGNKKEIVVVVVWFLHLFYYDSLELQQ